MAQLKDLIVNGASRFIGDIFGNKAQLTTLDAPTAAGGSTYGPGTSGQVLKTNGTSIYWGADNNSGGTVTSVRVQATSPVVSSVNTAQTGTLNTTISLANNYGDTKNPYASKTKNYVLAAPSNANGAPSFRALVAADIPDLDTYLKKSGGTMTGALTLSGAPTADLHAATKKYVDDAFAANDAMIFKGTISGGSTGNYGALTQAASRGWTYKVDTAGKINGVAVEIGDILICLDDNTAAATSSDYATAQTHWVIVQNNVDGAVFKSSNSFTDGKVIIADGTNGKVKTSGYTIGASIGTGTAQYGIAYYSTTTNITSTAQGTNGALLTGKGANAPTWKASANGAVYATSANGDLQWGTLPTAQGGTGNTAFTQWGIIYANPATKLVSTSAGTAGYPLIGSGSAAPAWYGGQVNTGTAAASWITTFNGTTASTSTTTGAVKIAGGLGVAGQVTATRVGAGGSNTSYTLYVNGNSQFKIGTSDNTSHKKIVVYGNNRYLSIGSAGLQAYTSATNGTIADADTASLLYLQDNGGNIQIGQSSTVTSNVNIYGDIIPQVDLTFNLGSTTNYWNNAYIKNIIYSSGEANRLVWTDSDKLLKATNHYADATSIAINSTTIPTPPTGYPTYNLYINGDARSSGDLYFEGTNNRLAAFKLTTVGTVSRANIDMGWDWEKLDGAGAAFRSTDPNLAANQIGRFVLFARTTADDTTQLVGAPTGELSWKKVSGTARIGINADANANYNLYVNGNTKIESSPAADTPLVTFVSNTTPSTGGYQHGLHYLVPNMVSDSNAALYFGKAASTGNAACLQMNWVENNHNNNFFGLGFWGVNNLLRIYKTGNVSIGEANNTYKLYVAGDMYTSGWARAASGFYCHDTGVHYTHKGNHGEINITKSNEMIISGNANTLYINYQAASRGTLVTTFRFHGGSSTSYSQLVTGHIVPGADNTYTLGSTSSLAWSYVCARNHTLYAGSAWYGDFYIYRAGTANRGDNNATRGTQGITLLRVGNNVAWPAAGTAGGANNSTGLIRLYAANQYYTEISAQGNGNRSFVLPNYNNTMYAVHAGDNNAVGSATQPVYVAANGRVTACTAYASAAVGYLSLPRVTQDYNTLPGNNLTMIKEYSNSSANKPTNHWYHAITSKGLDGNYATQFAMGMTITRLYYRNYSGATWSAWKQVWIAGDAVTSAVWNDYAEYRETDTMEAGRCVIEVGDDSMTLSTKRLQRGCSITSDTWGFAQGETEKAKTPIAVSGRVLAYPYESREEFASHIGWPVCSGPNGTVSIMTEEEEEKYPSRIVGIISAIPDYEEWGGGENADRPPVKVNGRVWIKVK